MAKKLAEDVPVIPVSQTHRVTTVQAELKSAYGEVLDQRQEQLRDLEDELLEESLRVIHGAMKFADIDPSLVEPDQAFYERFKNDPDPEKLFRLMKYGQMSTSKAPAGLTLAQKTAIGILKARAAEKGEIRPLAVSVQVVQSMPQFERIIETDGE